MMKAKILLFEIARNNVNKKEKCKLLKASK
jgi:hypothetical protein